jgi:hypothetical protein
MNSYLLRSVVAVLTFLIGVAVSPISRPFKYRRWEHKHPAYFRYERHCRASMTFPSPALSIDTASTDPVKLLYSQTRTTPDDFRRQKVDFFLENISERNIGGVDISYRSSWASNRRGGGGGVRVTYGANVSSAGVSGLQVFSIDCDPDETLSLWISAVEFKDGSTWNNPRHPDD